MDADKRASSGMSADSDGVLAEDWFEQEYLCSFIAMSNQAFKKQWIEEAVSMGLNQRRLFAEGGF